MSKPITIETLQNLCSKLSYDGKNFLQFIWYEFLADNKNIKMNIKVKGFMFTT